MPESIAVGLKRVAVILAEELDYARAAERLGISSSELQDQVSTLEATLCVHLFKPGQMELELTDEGDFLIRAFRDALALHDRGGVKDLGNTP